MARIIGQSGRLNLRDSYVIFEHWNINANIVRLNEPSQSSWLGSFEILKSDYFSKVFNSIDEPLNADFYGDENCYGKIIIVDTTVSPHGKTVTIDFRGNGGLRI
jgi:hypothetical protein